MKKLALLIMCAILCITLITSCGTELPGIGGGAADDTKTAEYVPGTVSEAGYVSDYLGLEFTPVGDLVMATEDELLEAMGIGADMAGMDKSEFDWGSISNTYEMMATDYTTGDNVIVMAEKLALKNISMEQYIEALKSQFDGVEGMEVTFDSTSEVQLAGQTYTRLDMTTSVSGLTIKQVMLLRKVGDRMIGITVTSVTEGAEDTLLACFKAK